MWRTVSLSRSIDEDGSLLGRLPGDLEWSMLSRAIDHYGNIYSWRPESLSEYSESTGTDSESRRVLSAASDVRTSRSPGTPCSEADEVQLHLGKDERGGDVVSADSSCAPSMHDQGEAQPLDVMKTAAAGLFQNVSRQWVDLRRKSVLSHSTDAFDPVMDELVLPSFNPRWQTEFEETQVHAVQIKLIAACVGLPLIYVTYFYLLAEYADVISAGVGWEWAVLQWSGYCMVILVACSIIVIFSVPWAPLQRFSVKYFELLAGSVIMLSLTGVFWTTAVTELRRSTSHERVNMFNMENSAVFENLTYSMDRSGIFPKAECYDSSTSQTLLSWNSFDEPGCSSRLVYGTTVTYFIAICLFSHVLNLSSRRAIQITVICQVLCIIMCLVVGKHALSMWATLLLMGIAGMVDALHCHLKRGAEAQKFLQTKVQKFASSAQRALLHTLIPPNVLDNMRGPNEGVCTEIHHVTMMFCSFDLDVSTKKDFDFLDCVLEALDKSVLYSGMHKYQHVSCGNAHYYIVGCPRIACPFDVDEQFCEYPRHYSVNMIHLGRQLSRIVSKFAAPNRPLHMKIGINCGPVASVVLGKCRRYYCVYGNTGSPFLRPWRLYPFIPAYMHSIHASCMLIFFCPSLCHYLWLIITSNHAYPIYIKRFLDVLINS